MNSQPSFKLKLNLGGVPKVVVATGEKVRHQFGLTTTDAL